MATRGELLKLRPTPPFLRVMGFIDGQYLRKGYKKLVGHDNISFEFLMHSLVRKHRIEPSRGELTRTYYYDAIVDASDDLEKHKQQKEYLHNVGLVPQFEVKCGRLIRTGDDEYRQKGVDILISIDMLTKAFQNFYDYAFFIAGDDDFVDLVNAVKTVTNKRVYGVAFKHNVSPRLLESFDVSYILTKHSCEATSRSQANSKSQQNPSENKI